MGYRRSWLHLVMVSLLALEGAIGLPYGWQGLQGLAQTSVAQASRPRQAEASGLLRQGNQQKQRGQFQAALQSYQQALKLYQLMGDYPAQAGTLRNLGDTYQGLNQYPQAIASYQQSLEIARQVNAPEAQVSALLNLGNVYYYQGELQKAVQTHTQAIAIARRTNSPELVNVLSALANEYFALGQYPQATQAYQETLKIAQQLRDFQRQADALSGLGNLYNEQALYPQAIQFYQQALQAALKGNDLEGELIVLGNLGIAHTATADYPQAIQFHQQSLTIARKLKNLRHQASALSGLGSTYQAKGEYQQAIQSYQQAIEIERQIDHHGELITLNNLATTYAAMGKFPQALQLFQQNLERSKARGDRDGVASALANQGNLNSTMGLYEQAIPLYEQALKIQQQLGDRTGKVTSLIGLGNAYYGLKQNQNALDSYQQALEMARKTGNRAKEASALINLGNIHQSLGQYQQSISWQQQALEIARKIGDRQAEASALGNLGIAYGSLAQYSQAVAMLQQQLKITQTIGDRQGEARALGHLGRTLSKEKKFADAKPLLLNAIQIRESLRTGLSDQQKIAIFDTQTDPYQALQDTFIALNQPAEALEIAERGRARAFSELLARQMSSGNLETFQPPTLQQIQQIAREQSATLVEYSNIYGEKLFIWVVKPSGEVNLRTVDLTALKMPLNALVDSGRTAMGVRGLSTRPSSEAQSQHLQQLHQLLIEPIADLLPASPSDRVIFMPQGVLFLVPFAALQNPNGQYLIEKHTVLTAPSIQVLSLTRLQQSRLSTQNLASSPALVLGNPTMPRVPLYLGGTPQLLPPLPGAEKEAIAIAPLLQSKALTGSQATKAATVKRMAQARIIHLATHGLLDDINGLGSAIALAPTGGDNGLLSAEEILSMKLKADLVVLSACDTGRGRITGDGVIGLSRSFISAGVPSVIVSLWSIPDAPTAQLMTTFYQQLQQNPDKAQALRQAMLSTLKTHPNPKDWAAFTLIGEAK